MFRQDYMIRLIEDMIAFVIKVLFQQDTWPKSLAQVYDTARTAPLKSALQAALAQGGVNAGEDRLFAELQPGEDYLEVALAFYSELNTWTEAELVAQNFSRAEILQGVMDIAQAYGLSYAFTEWLTMLPK